MKFEVTEISRCGWNRNHGCWKRGKKSYPAMSSGRSKVIDVMAAQQQLVDTLPTSILR